ncbi:MAG: XdhC family protein [Treponema sp.]|jgi:xanthine dehydrogenase accessory factor|nr:XdhC family protein [Treponema sp.]
MKEIFKALLTKTIAGEDTVLATIVAEIGSSPRSAGAHMLVDKNGRVCGTIGGGTVEYKSILYARNLLEKRKSGRKTYRLYRNDEEELGMLCGGNVDVYFQFIRGGDEKTISLMKECLLCLERDEDIWVFTDLTNPNDWIMALYGTNIPLKDMEMGTEDIKALARNKGVMVNLGEKRIYSDPINFAGKVFIFGGGHCARALQPVLSTTGFRCVVFDNREEFVSRELFPSAYDLVIGDYEHIDRHIDISSRDYIVIMTHAWDVVVLRQVISKNCAYIGVIGSKTKITAVKQQLKSEGVSDGFLNRINAPIGLRIRSETPEEIAISIAGEMILRRAEQRASATGKS